MTEPSPGEAAGDVPSCANCGAPVPDRFCGRCGQERRTLRVGFGHLVGESLAEVLSFDSKIARTLKLLLLHPGSATRSYLDGKRASQTSPVKLYLLLSFLYFFIGALTPSQMRVNGGSAEAERERVVGVQVGEGGLRELRSRGGVASRLADRIEAFTKLPPEEARRRLGASLAENTPKAMFFLVPVLALLLRLFFLRSGLYFAEDVVAALHMHAVAYLFLVPGELAGSSDVTSTGMIAAAVHATAAMRRVYGRGWGGTIARALAVGFLYLLALALALAVVVMVAVWNG